jgi:hypothetical protein
MERSTQELNVGRIPYQVFQYAVIVASNSLLEEYIKEGDIFNWRLDIHEKNDVFLTISQQTGEVHSVHSIEFEYTNNSVITISGECGVTWGRDYDGEKVQKTTNELLALYLKHITKRVAQNLLPHEDQSKYSGSIAETFYICYPYAFNIVTCANLTTGEIEDIRFAPNNTILKGKEQYCLSERALSFASAPLYDSEGKRPNHVGVRMKDTYGFGSIWTLSDAIIMEIGNDNESWTPIGALFGKKENNFLNVALLLNDGEKDVRAFLSTNGFVLDEDVIKTRARIYHKAGNHSFVKKLTQSVPDYDGIFLCYESHDSTYCFLTENDTLSIFKEQGEEIIKASYTIKTKVKMKEMKKQGPEDEFGTFKTAISRLKPEEYKDGSEFTKLITAETLEEAKQITAQQEWNAAHPILAFIEDYKKPLLIGAGVLLFLLFTITGC